MLTGGPSSHSQNQFGQSSPSWQLGALFVVVGGDVDEPGGVVSSEPEPEPEPEGVPLGCFEPEPVPCPPDEDDEDDEEAPSSEGPPPEHPVSTYRPTMAARLADPRTERAKRVGEVVMSSCGATDMPLAEHAIQRGLPAISGAAHAS